jgi:hypothetical protein
LTIQALLQLIPVQYWLKASDEIKGRLASVKGERAGEIDYAAKREAKEWCRQRLGWYGCI